MAVSPEERLLIDRYLEGSLSGLELQKFMERLDSDENFRTAVSVQNLLVEGIVRCADEELQKNLLISLGYKKPSIPLGLKLTLTFLIITLSGIILWNYIAPDSSRPRKNLLTFSWLRSEHSGGEKEDGESGEAKSNSRNIQNKGEKSISPTEEKRDASEDQESPAVVDTSAQQENEESPSVIVKQDQLLISQRLPVIEDSLERKSEDKKNKKSQNTLSNAAAQRMKINSNEDNETDFFEDVKNLEVEFWVSPINYRGYKFHRDRLILFGISEPDAVRLIRKDDKLYLRYFNEIYLLEPADEFTSYLPVKEKEIISRSNK